MSHNPIYLYSFHVYVVAAGLSKRIEPKFLYTSGEKAMRAAESFAFDDPVEWVSEWLNSDVSYDIDDTGLYKVRMGKIPSSDGTVIQFVKKYEIVA